MDNEKRVRPKISFWTVLYIVLVAVCIIGNNIYVFVRARLDEKEFREMNTIERHHYIPYLSDGLSSWPKDGGFVRNGTITEMYGLSSNGEKISISEIRPEQIGNEYITGWLKIADSDGTAWYYVDNRTAFTIESGGPKVDVIKPGEKVSFQYAVYDDGDALILGFIEDCDSSSEGASENWLYPPTLVEIGRYALMDLPPLIFFVCLYFIVRFIRAGKRKRVIIPLIIACICMLLLVLLIFLSSYLNRAKAAAPVIYLYPEEETEVCVRLALNGELTTSYPVYDPENGWIVTAYPDGTLTDKNGREYPFLFWEGEVTINPDLSRGFCVKGEDTAVFLEESLKQLGLTDTEADTFIMYWLPQMEGNQYNVISFQTVAYEDAVSHYVIPEPDTVITVNMLWYPSNTPVSIEPQDLTAINPSERTGFTVVEWGGEKYRKHFYVSIT